jgi:hypothetical protein
MMENLVLMMISKLNAEEVTGSWRKLHNKKHHDFYNPILMTKDHMEDLHTGGEMTSK